VTADEYREALKTLGLTQLEAGRILGVSNRTAQEYASRGPSGPASLAIELLLAMSGSRRKVFLRERQQQ
jgi:hypothetical protein